jgi:ATP-dependent Clp protease ATP-binding subunit ClpA
LKRAIQREVVDPLAKEILACKLTEGQTIKVGVGENGLTFTTA